MESKEQMQEGGGNVDGVECDVSATLWFKGVMEQRKKEKKYSGEGKGVM